MGYNDGEWHMWNGGVCPVHSQSIIHKVYPLTSRLDELLDFTGEAGKAHWASSFMFRVVTPYVEPVKPLECWAVYDQFGRFVDGFENSDEAYALSDLINFGAKVFLMREVVE